MNMKGKKVVVTAIAFTKVVDAQYWRKTLEQRLPGGGVGSVILGVSTPEELEQALLEAEWEAYSHPAISEGCTAFRTRSLRGLLGVKPLAELPAGTTVTLDDRKGTGRVSAVVEGVRGDDVDFLVLIVGEEDGREIVFTVHPGEPVRPSSVQATPGLHGKKITVEEALGMGLSTAKLV
ncbi:MAG: hypothetical protein B7X04_02205 [Parcubacteria group bacterium 21-54-25]|nr:MAG: hypothetical protein B7X04_02205 [Parcubacteria group bacterium 21-54-25]HQU07860.1 hypothetical protein [Candidatus Paceibacterota bacterium]